MGAGRLATCGQLSTSVPVWRARYTPFGDGLATVLVPHLGASDHSLFLWNVGDLSSPVHTFVGHRDVILDLAWWRAGPGEHRLVTWSRDMTLRLWQLDQDIQYRCGVEEEEEGCDLDSLGSEGDTDPATEAVEAVESDAGPAEVRQENRIEQPGEAENGCGERNPGEGEQVNTSSPGSRTDCRLQQEFSLLDTTCFSSSLTVEPDLERRTCRVVAAGPLHTILLSISFPSTYPANSPPIFSFLRGSTLAPASRARILRTLQETAATAVRRNRACLERCLRQLDLHLEQLSQEAERGETEEGAGRTSLQFVKSSEFRFVYTNIHHG